MNAGSFFVGIPILHTHYKKSYTVYNLYRSVNQYIPLFNKLRKPFTSTAFDGQNSKG